MAKGRRERAQIRVEVEFTEGYEQRFTAAILKIYENRLRKAEKEAICGRDAQPAAG